MPIIVVDGNDGTGKSTMVAWLRQLGYTVTDRGVPTKMTDDATVQEYPDEVYLILDAPVELSRARLQAAGKDLTEKYHTIEDLTFYRAAFARVAERLSRVAVIDTSGTFEQTQATVQSALQRFGFTQP